MMRRRWATIAAGTPAVGTSAVIIPLSHRKQWSKVSFRINGEEGKLSSYLAEGPRSKVSGLAPHYLYHRNKTEATIRNPHSG
jgi:hypothetical protein